ncbi:MAG: hypothetical protein ACI9WS_000628 [Paraglaciecola psychrophila]|jgi:hypothetical protein
MIEQNLEKWHAHLGGELEGGLDELLHDDCIFYSPIVFSPQRGKTLTKLYLGAAGNTFNDGDSEPALGKPESKFKYIKEVLSGDYAVLEFESEIDGKYINGVDIMSFNEQGKIVEFKVMIRPLQAINTLHEKMKAMLDTMK